MEILPLEMWAEIFKNVKKKDRMSIILTCRAFQKAAQRAFDPSENRNFAIRVTASKVIYKIDSISFLGKTFKC